MKLFVFFFVFIISFSQTDSIHLLIISKVGPLDVIAENKTYKVRTRKLIFIKKNEILIKFKNDSIDTSYKYNLQRSDTLIINKNFSANVYFFIPKKSNFVFSNQEYSYIYSNKNIHDTLKFRKLNNQSNALISKRVLKEIDIGTQVITIKKK